MMSLSGHQAVDREVAYILDRVGLEKAPFFWAKNPPRHGTDASPCSPHPPKKTQRNVKVSFLQLFHRKMVCRFAGLYSFLFVFFFVFL